MKKQLLLLLALSLLFSQKSKAETEPNDSPAQANPLAIGGTQTGTVAGTDLEDWFELNLPTDGLLSLDILKNGLLPANAYLHDANGQIAVQYLDWNTVSVIFEKKLSAGKYWLVFRKGSGDFQYEVAARFLAKPVAEFSAGMLNNTLITENLSTGEQNTYRWDFGDGSTSPLVNPLHEYTSSGDFDISLVATNPGGADTAGGFGFLGIMGVSGIFPAWVGNTGDATVTVLGGGLDTSFRAKIMLGATLIAQSDFTGVPGKSQIAVRFDLQGKPVGTFDFVVEKPGGPSYNLQNAFRIEAGTPPDPWATLGGRSGILFNTWATYTIHYGNRGNVDAKMVPIWLSFEGNQLPEIQFPGANIFEPDTTLNPTTSDGLFVDLDSLFGQPAHVRVFPLLLPCVAASSSNAFQIRVKSAGDLKIRAWTENAWFGPPVNQNKLECLGQTLAQAPPELHMTDKVECAKTAASVALDWVNERYEIDRQLNPGKAVKKPEFFTTLLRCVKLAAKVCGVTSAADRDAIGKWVANVMVNRFMDAQPGPAKLEGASGGGGGPNCTAEFAPQNPMATTLTAVSSFDPNEKTGLTGFGPEHFIGPVAALPYTIHFENVASASTSVHKLVVYEQPNWPPAGQVESFGFGPIVIGDSVLVPPSGAWGFVYDLENIIPGKVTVRVSAWVDIFWGIPIWEFQSFDPTTLAKIENPDLGFLPPNVHAPEGQGSVSVTYTLGKPIPHGHEFRNSGSIFFENANPPILTNVHLLTCDARAPESAVAPLPATTKDEQFAVSWSGTDEGSGVQFFNVYVSENGRADSVWLARATANSVVFSGKMGNSYAFYSVAVDNVGNLEAAPTSPDAQISVLVGTSDLPGGNSISVFPNPAAGRVFFLFEKAVSGEVILVRPDGSVVFSRKISGEEKLEIPLNGLPGGVCFWRFLGENGGSVAGKLLVAN